MRSVFVVIAMSLVSGAVMVASASVEKFCATVRDDEKNRQEMFSILEGVKEALDKTISDVNDIGTRDKIEVVLSRAGAKNVLIEDGSSGINLRFCPEKILKNGKVAMLAESGDVLVDYGWANSRLSHERNDFPLSNAMPLMNVYEIDIELLRALCSVLAIHDEGKVENLIRKIERCEPMEQKDVLEALSARSDSDVAAVLGTKTSFWIVKFNFSERYAVRAVFAAFPEDIGSASIKEYRIIERRVDVL